MSSIYLLLKEIKKQPLIYLGEKNLRYLRAFIDGYLQCEEDRGDYRSTEIFDGLKKYIENFYNSQSAHDYCSIITMHSKSTDEAFDRFFEHFDAYFGAEDDENGGCNGKNQ